MLKNHHLKQFNNILLLIGSFLAASCANQTTSSGMVSALQSTNNERAPLTKTPKQVLVGKWIDTSGTPMIIYANGNFDMPSIGMQGPGSNSAIPQGMVLVDGVLKRGKMTWNYDGNSSEGILKIDAQNYDDQVTLGFLVKINFINDKKMICTHKGKSDVAQKISQP